MSGPGVYALAQPNSVGCSVSMDLEAKELVRSSKVLQFEGLAKLGSHRMNGRCGSSCNTYIIHIDNNVHIQFVMPKYAHFAFQRLEAKYYELPPIGLEPLER